MRKLLTLLILVSVLSSAGLASPSTPHLALRLDIETKTSAVDANPLFPASADPIADTLGFMERVQRGSRLPPEVITRLHDLRRQGKFVARPLAGTNIAFWIESAETLTLNSNVLSLTDDYAAKAEACRVQMLSSLEPSRVERLERQQTTLIRLHQERILELSAALVHEGTHAHLGNTEDARADETLAYTAEAQWLRTLWDRLPDHRGKIRQMENALQDSYPGNTNAPILRTLPKNC